MTETILLTIFLFLPAFIANATPVVVKNIPGLSQMNAPIWAEGFGKNKTWRGLLSGILLAVLTALIQFYFFPEWLLVSESPAFAVLVGLLLGSGALFGDIAKSYAKRRIGIAPGGAWPVIDGIDYMVGAILLFSPLFVPQFWAAVVLLAISPILSLVSNTVSYFLGLKNVWY